jgi:antitoxin component YwqK of YwqJK toxin-antitoxin module
MIRILALTLLLIIVSCSSNRKLSSENSQNRISKEYHEDGTYSEWKYVNGQLVDGKSYFKSGVVLEDYSFKNGKRDGISNRYYESGEKEIIWEFRDDIVIGGTGYFKTGEKKYDFRYENGQRNGHTIEYFKSGKKKMEWNYSNDKLKGQSIEYFENGDIKDVWNY